MKFTLKYKEINEEREIPNENYTINDLLNGEKIKENYIKKVIQIYLILLMI